MTYWQVAAGSEGRDYTDAFLTYGMAFVGGESQCRAMAEVQRGDYILLKRGRTAIAAAGEVVERGGTCGGDGDKEWLRDFDGWDLPAYRYVRWHVPDVAVEAAGLVRAGIQRVHGPQIIQCAEQIVATSPALKECRPEPIPTKPVDYREILTFLVREGLRPGDAEELASAFERIRVLANYYYEECDWRDIREHETRTFLVLPLMLGLGWVEQQLKIELTNSAGRIDVACFSKPYRRGDDEKPNNEDCRLIVETKGFSSGLDYAPQQARGYAVDFPQCRAIAVTNGYCYKVYLREADQQSFSMKAHAYLNLLKPKDRYPLDPENIAGCLDVLKVFMPHSWR
jgi:hypothetical protein